MLKLAKRVIISFCGVLSTQKLINGLYYFELVLKLLRVVMPKKYQLSRETYCASFLFLKLDYDYLIRG